MSKLKSEEDINLVYIVSYGHSGSTLLDLLIGQHPKVTSIGEINKIHTYLDDESPRRDKRCTCGNYLSECDFWNPILSSLNIRDYTYPLDDKEKFKERNLALFRSIAESSSNNFVVDSSKSLKRLIALKEIKEINVKTIHLVRDGRAVAYSYERKKSKVANMSKYERDYMNKDINYYNYEYNLNKWIKFNDEVQKKVEDDNYIMVRYEDLVRDTLKILNHIYEFIGVTEIFKHNINNIDNSHNISGNQMRFTFEKDGVKADTEYRKKISTYKWYKNTIKYLFELRKYKYIS